MTQTPKTENELSAAINLLMDRMGDITAKSVEHDIFTDSMNIKAIESGFRNTVREIFGSDSPEFQEYGHLEMLYGPLRDGIKPGKLLQARLKGRDYMAAICVELIRRLQRKILVLRLQSPKLIHNVSAHPRIEEATRELLANGHIWEAVFAASKALVLLVKDLSGRPDLDGVALMRTVFSKNNPILRFNALANATDHDE